MIRFLRGLRAAQQDLREQRLRQRRCVESREESIRRLTFSRGHADPEPVFTGYSTDKVFRILMNSERDLREEVEDILEILEIIDRKEDEIQFVRRCLAELPGWQQSLLTGLYIDGEGAEHMMDKLCVGRTSLYHMAREALGALLRIYNAGCEEAVLRRCSRNLRIREDQTKEETPA